MKNKIKIGIIGGYVKVGDYAIINKNYNVKTSVGKRIKIKSIISNVQFPIANMQDHIFSSNELTTVKSYKNGK